MAEFHVRSETVNVEQIMEQIRARIREKRGDDYVDAEIRSVAAAKIERLLGRPAARAEAEEQQRGPEPAVELPNFSFEDDTLFESTRAPLRVLRRLLLPILKLFFNPNPLIRALHLQSKLNAQLVEREERRQQRARSHDQQQQEVLHNVILEMAKTTVELKALRMRVESLAGRLEFAEGRTRALESAVLYRPAESHPRDARDQRGERAERDRGGRPRDAREFREPREARESPEPRDGRETRDTSDKTESRVAQASAPEASAPAQPGATQSQEGGGQRSRRRRRRRGRRGGAGPAAAEAGGAIDQRTTRPEPFEQSHGAEARPAEQTVDDPSSAAGADDDYELEDAGTGGPLAAEPVASISAPAAAPAAPVAESAPAQPFAISAATPASAPVETTPTSAPIERMPTGAPVETAQRADEPADAPDDEHQ